ncbi:MAG: VOC family protein [Cyanobacteria bacterium J06560_2]
MAFEFDHLFICTDVDAPAAAQLLSFGLSEGSSNIHPGQGTANRRFFFENAMLELLWVHDRAEAISAPIRRTHLWERWQQRASGACPFGICLRASESDHLAPDTTIAFEHWAFCPPYLPKDLAIAVGTNSHINTEPLVFQTPFGKRPDAQPPEKAQPLVHPVGLKAVTKVTLMSPTAASPSDTLKAVIESGALEVRNGSAYCVALEFDHKQQGKQISFQPRLPLVIHY